MGKIATGSIQMPSTYTKNSGSPLDDRDLVENKIDLITSSTWTVGSDDTRYEGMIVYVANESKLYCLIDISKKDTSDYSGWKDITADTAGVTSVGLSMPNIFNVSGSPITNSGTITASFTNQNDKTIFGRNSGSSGVPSFIDATNLWSIEGIGDNANTTGLLKKTAQNTWTLTSNYSDIGLYNKKLQHKLNSNTAIDVGDIIRETNSDLSLPKFYAPTTVGSQYAFLTSNGSGEPSWILPTLASGKTTGLLKYIVGSGWTFDSNTYLTSEQYTGTVTEITAGDGLNTTSGDTSTDGGTITSTGTLYLTKTAVTPGTYQGITVDKYGRITSASDQGYTTNTGTVTSVQVQATSPVLSSTSTASSTTLNTTISLDNAYGDTKNPYGSKTANQILAAPSGSSGVPSFRTLVSDDIPNLTISKISDFPTLANVATTGSYNDLQDTPTIPTVNNYTITITQGGVTKGSFTLNQSNDDTIALDAGGGTGNDYTTTLNNTSYPSTPASGAISLGSWYAPTTAGTQYDLLQANSSGIPTWLTPSSTGLLKFTSNSGWDIDPSTYLTSHQTLYNLTLKLGGTTSETYIPATNSTYEFNVPIYIESGGLGVRGLVPNATATEVTNGCYLKANGAWSIPSDTNYYHTPDYSTGLKIGTSIDTHVNDLYVPTGTTNTTVALGNHTHGNIQNNGTLQFSDITIGNHDKLVVTDYSNSHKIARTSIEFDGSTTTQYLSKKGTWETPGSSAIASASGTNPGLLKVQNDKTSLFGNTEIEMVSAIPIFYGEISELYVYKNGEYIGITGNQVWHYINIYSIIKAIENDEEVRESFKKALEL